MVPATILTEVAKSHIKSAIDYPEGIEDHAEDASVYMEDRTDDSKAVTSCAEDVASLTEDAEVYKDDATSHMKVVTVWTVPAIVHIAPVTI